LALFCQSWLNAQTLQEQFSELSVHQGDLTGSLNQRIKNTELDSIGFLWFGGTQGLYRYDGHELLQFSAEAKTKTTLSHNNILCLQAGLNGHLWVGTRKGLNYYDPNTNNFTQYLVATENKPNIIVEEIVADGKGNAWFATSDGLFTSVNGSAPEKIDFPDSLFRPLSINIYKSKIWVGGHFQFYVLDVKKASWQHYKINRSIFKTNPGDITTLLVWNDSITYFGTYSGLFSLNIRDSSVSAIKIQEDPKFAEQNKLIGNFGALVMDLEKSNQRIWVAYRFLGIAALNPQTNFWQTYNHNPGVPSSLMSNRAYGLFQDPFQNLWIGTIKGVQRYRENEAIQNYVLRSGYLNIENYIMNLFEDSQQRCWISSVQGLYLAPKFGEEAIKFPIGGNNKNYLRTKDASVIAEDLNGNIWIGGNKLGLSKYAEKGLERFYINKAFDRLVIYQIAADQEKANQLWLGSLHGIYVLNTQNKTIDTLAKIDPILNGAQFSFLLTKTVLTGFKGGKIYEYNRETKAIKTYEYPLLKRDSRVYKMAKDPNQNIWMATSNGLLIFDIKTKELRPAVADKKLQSEITYGIIFNNQKVWINTYRNIYAIGFDGQILKSYPLPNRSHQQFNPNAAAKMGGNICFGGTDGITVINENKIALAEENQTQVLPKTHITQVVLADSILSLNTSGNVEFNNKDNSISFRFSALHFSQPEQNTYRYKMNGLENSWKLSGTKKEVDFTHLPEGNYIFEVQSANAKGQWNYESAVFKFTILPPFWNTLWFKTTLLFLAILLTWVLMRIARKQKILKQERILADQRAAYKSKFLANMSHEIRTPLNAIMGLNHLLKESPLQNKQQQWSEGIELSSNNLMRIVNDILDQERIESGKYTIVNQVFDLKAVLNQSVNYFKQKAHKKDIELKVELAEIPSNLIGDPVRVSQIVINLVGNAVKFTDVGQVLVSANVLENTGQNCRIKLVVTDTGIGIPKEKQSSIFESFEQVRESDRNIDDGAGLGLSIAKQLIEQLGGTIKLESEVGRGSTFTVIFSLKADETNTTEKPPEESTLNTKANLRLLLVDDLALNRLLASELLKKNFKNLHLETAENGLEAVEKIATNTYDLILMDVKMPVMDGYEATVQIRKKHNKQDLPIIALTANAIAEQINKCTEVGMNDCITKPISEHELIEKINQLTSHESKN